MPGISAHPLTNLETKPSSRVTVWRTEALECYVCFWFFSFVVVGFLFCFVFVLGIGSGASCMRVRQVLYC